MLGFLLWEIGFWKNSIAYPFRKRESLVKEARVAKVDSETQFELGFVISHFGFVISHPILEAIEPQGKTH